MAKAFVPQTLDTREELQARVNDLQEQLRALEAIDRQELCRSLVGKCYRVPNSYGSGETWWLYRRVTGFTKEGYVRLFSFESRADDAFVINCAERNPDAAFGEVITAKAFQHAFKIFARMINDRARAAQALS